MESLASMTSSAGPLFTSPGRGRVWCRESKTTRESQSLRREDGKSGLTLSHWKQLIFSVNRSTGQGDQSAEKSRCNTRDGRLGDVGAEKGGEGEVQS